MNFVPLWLKDDVRNGERRGERKGRKEGKIEGMIEGKKEEKKEMALKMLADNLPLELIMKYTDLSEKQINELKGHSLDNLQALP